MRLGIVVWLGESPEASIDKVVRLGLPTRRVTVSVNDALTAELAERLRHGAAARGVEITSVWTHCRGEQVRNLVDGPRTIGLVPDETRAAAVARPSRRNKNRPRRTDSGRTRVREHRAL